MTDREVIRGFDLCENSVSDGKCNECPFGNNRDGCLNLNKYVLDLIKRQESEIEEYKKVNILIAKQRDGRDEYIAELEAENERLRKENRVMKTNYNSMCISMPNMAKAERAEAIKKFAKRLLTKAEPAEDYHWWVSVKSVKDLAKEMTGENNFKG